MSNVIYAEVVESEQDETPLVIYDQLVAETKFDPDVEPYAPDLYDMFRRVSGGQSATTWTRDNSEQLNEWLASDEAAAIQFRLKQNVSPIALPPAPTDES